MVGAVVFLIIIVVHHCYYKRTEREGGCCPFYIGCHPGKQMAIDADLNSGLIDENEAGSEGMQSDGSRFLRRNGRSYKIC